MEKSLLVGWVKSFVIGHGTTESFRLYLKLVTLYICRVFFKCLQLWILRFEADNGSIIKSRTENLNYMRNLVDQSCLNRLSPVRRSTGRCSETELF